MRRICLAMWVLIAIATVAAAPVIAQSGDSKRPTYTPPRTAWGHPDIQGIYTNKDEGQTPLERPSDLTGRREDYTHADLAKLAAQRQAQARKIAPTIGGAETGAGPTHWFEHFEARGSQPWMIVDPPDGKVPPMTPEGQRREAAMAKIHGARRGEGVADSPEDRSLYDRCITRGMPGSMMPAIYGNSYQILQTPDHVVIRYEMIHETRVIPLDGRQHVSSAIRQYIGDARARWEGGTLVVETTNFTDKTHFGYNNRYNSPRLKLIERFTPIAPDKLSWQVTFDDPDTWTRPWTFQMPLTKDQTQGIFEYACHEGNHGMTNILSGARAEEATSRR
jgi:hypothetical protein